MARVGLREVVMSKFPLPRGPLAGNMWNKPYSGARSRRPRSSQGPSGSKIMRELAMKRYKKLKGGR